jgi:RNA polymerase sigma factor (sigma-70 family)
MMQLLPDQSDQKDPLIGRLYQCYWLAILTAIRQHIASQEDAEDILLDVFLAAMENKMLSSMNEQFQEAWLRRVAYNKCMDFHRRAKTRSNVPIEKHQEHFYDDDDLSPEQTVLRQEERHELQRNLATLSKDQQELLRMRFAEELPYAQIAVHMQKSEGATRTMLARTLNLLRSIYVKKGRKVPHGQA